MGDRTIFAKIPENTIFEGEHKNTTFLVLIV